MLHRRSLERRPKATELAARAGVSVATVDRVINERGGVHHRTAEKVNRALLELIGQVDAPDRPSVAPRRLDVLLPAASGRSTEVLAEQAAGLADEIGAQVTISFVERINPAALAERLLACAREGADGVAFQGVDHPEVRWAMEELALAGVPVVTLCSDVAAADRLAYVGMDNRAAGRTGGFLMGGFCKGPGKLAVVWGGQLYRNHEEREAGFRAFLRHHHPELQIIEMLDGNDDAELNRQRMREAIVANPELSGVYCVGGGQKGVALALEEAGVQRRIVMIGHNFNEETRPFLLSGTIDVILHQDMAKIARIGLDCLLKRVAPPVGAVIPVEIVTRENMAGR